MGASFHVLLLLPSVAFAFLVLTTFYGPRRAYFAISWIPVTLALLIRVFQGLASFQLSPDYWLSELAGAVVWVSLVQGLLGVVLTVRAYRQGGAWFELLAAACLAGLPFVVGT